MEENFISNPHKKEEKKTLAEVIIAQIDVCRKEFSKEMKAGFNQKILFNDEWIVITIPDQREVDIASVKTLYDLLRFYFNEEFREAYKKIMEKEGEMGKMFLQQYIEEEVFPHLKKIAEETKRIPRDSQSRLSENIRQRHLNYRAELYRKVFSELVLLFKRKHELSGKKGIGYK